MKVIRQTGKSRICRGSAVIELAASLSIILPLIFLVLFAALETSTAYMIHTVLLAGAQQSARDLALAYPLDSSIAQNRASQDFIVYDKVRTAGIINSSAQFDDATFNTTANPPRVTVTVHYASGSYGLSKFPVEILGLSDMFHLSATSVYRLEEN